MAGRFSQGNPKPGTGLSEFQRIAAPRFIVMELPVDSGDILLTAAQLRARHNVSNQTLWRRMKDPALNFPQPIYIGRIRFWPLSEIVPWEQAQPRTAPTLAGAAGDSQARRAQDPGARGSEAG